MTTTPTTSAGGISKKSTNPIIPQTSRHAMVRRRGWTQGSEQQNVAGVW